MKFKSLLIIFAFIGLGITGAKAQIKKGSTLLGGSISVYSEKRLIDDRKFTSFQFSPAAGKAIKDNLVVGFDAYFSSGEFYDSTSYSQNNKSAGGGFFVRQYATLRKKFYLFGQARIGAGWIKTSYKEFGSRNLQEGYNINLSIYPGIAYSLTNKFQLEVGLPSLFSASFTNTKNAGAVRTKTFNANAAISELSEISLGFRFLLAK